MAKISELESNMAELAGERRRSPRLMIAGMVLFVGMQAAHRYPKRGGAGTTTVLPFTVYAGPRAAFMPCEVSNPELIEMVAGLVNGEAVCLGGQLVIANRFGGHARLRVTFLERAPLPADPLPISPRM